jgi:hypothetical protein
VKRDKRKPEKAANTAPPRARFHFDPRHALLGVVLLLALMTYSNSFHAPFLMDNSEILNDTRVHAATADNVQRIFTGGYHQSTLTGLYRPLTSLSFMYNWTAPAGVPDPAGYHSFNFLVHALNISLVYMLGLILFESIPAALALSALWGVHPVLTEGVTNIVGRADMMAAFGALGAVVAYHYSLRSRGTARAVLIAAIALATLVGSFSKESGIVALPLLALYDVLFAGKAPRGARLAGYLAAAAAVAVFLAQRARVLASIPAGVFPFLDNPIAGSGFVEGRLTAFKVIGKYLGLVLWPANLSQDYSYNEIPVAADAAGIAMLIVCLGAAALAVWSWRRGRALTFAIGFFFVALAPVSNVFFAFGSIMGERFVYLPSVGFVAAVVYGLHRLWLAAPSRRSAVAAAVGMAVVVLAFRAHARNEDWGDEVRFWRAGREAAPGSYKARMSWAGVMPRRNNEAWQRSLAEAESALAIIDSQPDERNAAFPYRNIGILYRGHGDFLLPSDPAGAERSYRRSLDSLLRSERIERLQDDTNRATNARRGLAATTYLPSVIYKELGITLLKLHDNAHALEMLEVGRNLESDPDLLENLATAYANAGDLRKAALALVEEMEMDGKRSYVTGKLFGIYRQIDPATCAVQNDGLNLGCPAVHADICAASRNVIRNYTRRNQTAEAESIARVAAQDLGCSAAELK